MKKLILTFQSIHHVLKGEKILKREGVAFDLVPVPKEVNPDCGMALELPLNAVARATGLLAENSLDIEGVYLRENNSFKAIELKDVGEKT